MITTESKLLLSSSRFSVAATAASCVIHCVNKFSHPVCSLAVPAFAAAGEHPPYSDCLPAFDRVLAKEGIGCAIGRKVRRHESSMLVQNFVHE
jgi:hypothetical protein